MQYLNKSYLMKLTTIFATAFMIFKTSNCNAMYVDLSQVTCVPEMQYFSFGVGPDIEDRYLPDTQEEREHLWDTHGLLDITEKTPETRDGFDIKNAKYFEHHCPVGRGITFRIKRQYRPYGPNHCFGHQKSYIQLTYDGQLIYDGEQFQGCNEWPGISSIDYSDGRLMIYGGGFFQEEDGEFEKVCLTLVYWLGGKYEDYNQNEKKEYEEYLNYLPLTLEKFTNIIDITYKQARKNSETETYKMISPPKDL